MDRFGVAANLLVVALLSLPMSATEPRSLCGLGAGLSANSRESKQEKQVAPQASNGGAQLSAQVPAGSAMHTITLTFDYDFTKIPACSDKVKTQCVAKFDVYDISGNKPYFLFSAPVPDGAHGVMKGITVRSPRLLFAVGKHRIAVSAQEPDGRESPPRDCKTIIEIKAPAEDASEKH